MSRITKRCLYCNKEFRPASIYQKYCDECRAERQRNFARSRKYAFCKSCGRVFLSVNGSSLCDRCVATRQKGGGVDGKA